MAKKKAVKPKKEDDSSDDEEIEAVYPKVDEKKKMEEDKSIDSLTEDVSSGDADEEDSDVEEEEEKPRFPDYKYLDLELNKALGENDYELMVEGQSHGFCNILVKHLLEIEGVNMCAYKDTGLLPATIFLRLENSKDYKIKDILYKGIESLRTSVSKVSKVFFEKLT